MPRQQSTYYPRGEGIDGRPPTSCIKCGHGDFGAINRKDRDSVRYMCKRCKKSYHVPRPGAAKSAVRTDGFITDNAVLGLSTRENVLKLYVDEGKVMAHNVVPARLGQNIRHVKMFTDDVLCCLKYGDVWGIDETAIEIRGSAQKPDAAIMEEFEKRHGHLTRYNRKTYYGEWEKARERSVRSASVSAKKWLTWVIDHKTRIIVYYIITDRRPGRREIYNLLKVAVNVAGIPKSLITDKYKAYSPAGFSCKFGRSPESLVGPAHLDVSIAYGELEAVRVSQHPQYGLWDVAVADPPLPVVCYRHGEFLGVFGPAGHLYGLDRFFF